MSRIEQHIVAAWAKRLAADAISGVIDALEQMEPVLSGDSGLANVWEEVCAQVQGEESSEWSAYENTIYDLLYTVVEGLGRDEQLALWAVTDEGWDYIYDHHDERNGIDNVSLNIRAIVSDLRNKVLSSAADYESPSLYHYIWNEYNPEDDEIEDEDDSSDVVMLCISREQIDSFDLESTLGFLRSLVPAQDSQYAWSFKGSLALVISGYDSDPRELFSIPEVCGYLRAIDEQWPFWFFFLTPADGSIKLVGMCLAPAIEISPGRAYIPPTDLQRVMERGFGAVNHLFDHYAFPESENEALSETVSEIFFS